MNNETNYKICDICGNLVDTNNIFNIQDKEICKSCVEKRFEQNEKFSPLATFICSLIPGLGQIYLGKKQKGIFLFLTFIMGIILSILAFTIFNILNLSYYTITEFIGITTNIILWILTIISYLLSLFDANISRKYIENNTYKDGFIDRLSYKFIKSKKTKYLEDKIIDKRLQ